MLCTILIYTLIAIAAIYLAKQDFQKHLERYLSPDEGIKEPLFTMKEPTDKKAI